MSMNKKPKNIQIPEELFSRICSYFLLGRREKLQETIICNELQYKLDKMQARQEYSERQEQKCSCNNSKQDA